MINDKKKLINKLNKIGIALSAEKDADKLLELILEESINITGSDAGSIYIKTVNKFGEEKLNFKITKNMSRTFEWSEFTLDINKNSIAGFAAFSKSPINLDSMDDVEKLYNITYDRSFDEKINYKTVNMLTIPMLNYEKEVVGVMQLINKKRNKYSILLEPYEIPKEIIPYTEEEEEIIHSLGAQAAILLERSILYNEIEELLTSFISAMVSTLDIRDVTTSGHSRRLAGYALHFIKTINKVDYGKYQNTYFNDDQIKELYYAALLHDIGKIGVPEAILQKQNKLTNERIALIVYRFKYIKKVIEGKYDYEELYNKLDEYVAFIKEINQTGYLPYESREKLIEISEIVVEVEGETLFLLSKEELKNLEIEKGNLTAEERKIINYHVVQSYDILQGIKWTKRLTQVPNIAGGHHEKLDGSGYPKGLEEDEISIQQRILAILDIYEALTARDRPYKPPMSVEKALDILKREVSAHHLDRDLLEIFINEGVYNIYADELDKIFQL